MDLAKGARTGWLPARSVERAAEFGELPKAFQHLLAGGRARRPDLLDGDGGYQVAHERGFPRRCTSAERGDDPSHGTIASPDDIDRAGNEHSRHVLHAFPRKDEDPLGTDGDEHRPSRLLEQRNSGGLYVLTLRPPAGLASDGPQRFAGVGLENSVAEEADALP